jgi:hypothetical protein
MSTADFGSGLLFWFLMGEVNFHLLEANLQTTRTAWTQATNLRPSREHFDRRRQTDMTDIGEYK